MADVEKSIDFILSNEDPGLTGKVTVDAGGVTRWGIAGRFHPTLDIRNLTLDQARQIYASEYVNAVSGIADQDVQDIVADCLVNPGPGAGAKCVQQAINALHPHALAVDGQIGPDTISRLNGCAPDDILPRLRMARSMYYFNLCQANPSSQPYLSGWLVRACR